jgi:4-amino-4-deoxy-L-arabinose transferase-like glycosyltransferase
MAIGGLSSGLATLLLLEHAPEADATWVWLFGLACLVAGSILVSRRPIRLKWRGIGRRTAIEMGVLTAILVLGIWLRLPDLERVPPNVHGDEAAIGLGARDILAGRLPLVFGTGWFDVPSLSFAIPAASMRVFGDDLTGLRLASVLEGVVSVLLLYLLARRLWGSRAALMAAALMAVAAWHIHFSRTGFHYMQATLATVLVLYLLIRGLQDQGTLDFILCGFAVGVCFEVYYAARIAPLISVVYVAYRGTRERGFWRTHGPSLVALALGGLVFLLPMAAVYTRIPSRFGSRAEEVLIFSPGGQQHAMGAYHVASLSDVLRIQVIRTLEAFQIRGETSLQYGHPAPLLDPWTGALVAIAILGVGLRLGSANGVLLAAWIWLTLLLGSVFTVDALFSPRVVPILPALALLPALLLDRAWFAVSRLGGNAATYAFGTGVLVVLGLALQANVHDYFDVQVVRRQPADRFTLLSQELNALRGAYRAYVIGREDFTVNYETPRFLAPHPDAVDVRNERLALPLTPFPPGGAAFILEADAPDYAQRVQAIRAAYPDAREQFLGSPGAQPVLHVLLVAEPAHGSTGSP